MSDKMREAFERAAKQRWPHIDLGHSGDGDYWDFKVQKTFEDFAFGYQTALAQQDWQEPIGYTEAGNLDLLDKGAPTTVFPVEDKEKLVHAFPVYAAPQIATIPEGYAVLPMELTAENGAKYLMLGEFEEVSLWECPRCDGDEDCDMCHGHGSYTYRTPVSWNTIKQIWRKAATHFAAPEQPTAPAEQWIPCSERLPTGADFSDTGMVWAVEVDGGCTRVILVGYHAITRRKWLYTHWMPTNLKRPAPPESE